MQRQKTDRMGAVIGVNMVTQQRAEKTVAEFLRSGLDRTIVNRSKAFENEHPDAWIGPLKTAAVSLCASVSVVTNGSDVYLVRGR